MNSPVGSGVEERRNKEAFRCWTATDFIMLFPAITLQKEIFGSSYFEPALLLPEKMFLDSGSNPEGEGRGCFQSEKCEEEPRVGEELTLCLRLESVSKLVLMSLCQGLCWLGLKHLEGEVTEYSLLPASQMHFTALQHSHYLISAARSHLVCADIV